MGIKIARDVDENGKTRMRLREHLMTVTFMVFFLFLSAILWILILIAVVTGQIRDKMWNESPSEITVHYQKIGVLLCPGESEIVVQEIEWGGKEISCR